MNNRYLPALTLSLLVAGLAGCETLPPPPPSGGGASGGASSPGGPSAPSSPDSAGGSSSSSGGSNLPEGGMPGPTSAPSGGGDGRDAGGASASVPTGGDASDGGDRDAAGTAQTGAGGGTSGAGTPAAGTSGGGGAAERQDGSADAGIPAQTPGERRAGIDSQLDASLGRFDDQLRREQQRTAEMGDARAAGRPDAGAGGGDEFFRDRSGDLRSESSTVARSGGGARTGTGDGVSGGDASAGGGGQRGSGGVSALPIPSGADDDIVARRLRRAAEAETDPELQEKLWKEYIDYKQNTRGGA